jgi:hypothetical protein
MAAVTKYRAYGKITGFWIITQKPLIISEIWYVVKIGKSATDDCISN